MTDDIDGFQTQQAAEEATGMEEVAAELAAADDPAAEQDDAGLAGSGMPSPGALMGMLQSDDGFEQLALKPVFPTDSGQDVSQAAVLADVINIYRMDAKMLARLHDVDLTIERITERKVGWMLGQMIEGNPAPLIDCFNAIEDYHHEVFAEVLPEAEFERYKASKERVLYTQGADTVAEADAPDDGKE